MNPKRTALWFLIGSVAVSAVIGIIAIVIGAFGKTEARILLTTLAISAASICALACGALWESGRVKLLPMIGIALAIFAAILLIAGIWWEPSSDGYWKFTASAGLMAAATAHVCLLALARLAPRFVWSQIAAYTAAYLLAFLFIYLIYTELRSETFIRVIGVTSTVLAAVSILTPVFHRLSRGDLTEPPKLTTLTVPQLYPTITCPQCGASLPNSPVDTFCGQCGCKFRVTILDTAPAAGGSS
jgi:hypothetical protein